jgi:uncharacterized protein (DUF885 family)
MKGLHVNLKWMAISLVGGTVMAGSGGLAPSSAQTSSANAGTAAFNHLADDYFNQVYFKYSPTQGTLDGFHQYDTVLEDYSRGAVDREVAALKEYETKFAAIAPASLDLTAQGDLELVLGNIRSTLLTLETIRPWQKNPDSYSSGITESAFALMERTFAPPDARLQSLIAREKQMPAALDAARQNLENPPHVSTEIALEQLPGLVSFFQSDVPQAFSAARDPHLKAEFAQTNAAVIAALEGYQAWLKSDLLARSNGDFRIGADTYQKKLE